MAPNFLLCDRDQELLLPPSLREWLPGDHLAWFVLDAVEEMDLTAFFAAYREDGWGRAAFDPQMMVALLLYSYAVGERSSRGIERRCREDVAFRVITANRIPDHATIARCRARHEQALADAFVQVLALCATAGLVSVGLVALDGSLLSGNASPGATRSYATIREEVERMLAQAAEADAAEDERLGEARGDELPAELSDPRSRRGAAAPLQRATGSRTGRRTGCLPGESGLAGCLGGRARTQARRAQANAARGGGARRPEDQHDRPGHAPDETGRRPLGAGLQRPGRRQPRASDHRRPGHAVTQRLRPARTDGRKRRRHAARRGHPGADRDRARGRWLLELARDHQRTGARHPRAHARPEPPA